MRVVKIAAIAVAGAIALAAAAYWYLGTRHFANFIRNTAEETLASHLGRHVTIGRIAIVRTSPQHVIVRDLRIENLAAVREIDVTAVIDSIWQRRVRIERIDVSDPRVEIDVEKLPRWKQSETPDWVGFTIDALFVHRAAVHVIDRQHGIDASLGRLNARVHVANGYDVALSAPDVKVRATGFAPLHGDLRAALRYRNDTLDLTSIRLRGDPVDALVTGRITRGHAYDLRLRGSAALEALLIQKLGGSVAVDATLRGNRGKFALNGRWSSPRIRAGTNEFTAIRGRFAIDPRGAKVDVASAAYSGGTIGGRYELLRWSKPYPMSVAARYAAVSIPNLLTGSGEVTFRWNGDRIAEGTGSATLETARGSARLAMSGGVVRLQDAQFATPSTTVRASGSLRLADRRPDLAVTIRSEDFDEIDRAIHEFFKTAAPIGIGGRGDIELAVRGSRTDATITAPKTLYNGVDLGRAQIEASYDNKNATITRATIEAGGGSVAINGTASLASFHLAVEASRYPLERILRAAGVHARPTTAVVDGHATVAGSPKAGHATLAGVTVRKDAAEIRADGGIEWPLRLDLTLAARSVPVADLLAQLDAAKVPIAGAIDADAQLRGAPGDLDGSGSVVVKNAAAFGEAIDTARARVALERGTLHITDLRVASAAKRWSIDANAAIARDRTLSGSARVEADLAASTKATGRIAADLTLGGNASSLEAIRVDGSMPQLDVEWSGFQFTAPRPIRFGVRGGNAVIDDFEVQQGTSTFRLAGTAQLTGAKELDVTCDGDMQANLIELFVPGARADGTIRSSIKLGGTIGEPELGGSATIRASQLRLPELPQPVQDIDGALEFTRDQIVLKSLNAKFAGGTLAARGTVAIEEAKVRSIDAALDASNLTLRNVKGFTVAGGGSLALRGDPDHMILRGSVDVTQGLYSRDVDVAGAIREALTTRRAAAVAPVESASWKDRITLDVAVKAKNTLAVRNNVADVSASADLNVQGTLASPSVLGAVDIAEGGIVRLQANHYRVANGSINFQNPFRIDPYFDVTLEGRLSIGSSDFQRAAPVDVTVNLAGTMDRFTPSISTNPPTPDVTVLSLLGFSGSENPEGAGSTVTGAPIGFMAQSIVGRSMLKSTSINYDPGITDQVDDPGPKMTFQSRFPNDVLLLIVYNLERSHTRSRLEWQYLPDWSLLLTQDEVRQENRVESRLSRRYDGHWTWGTPAKPVVLSTSAQPLAGQVHETNVVTGVVFRPDAPYDTARLANSIAVRKGQPLAIRDVQTSIKALFATGDFRDVSAEREGSTLAFLLFLNDRVSDVRIEGLSGSDAERAERDVIVRAGDVVSQDDVEHSAAAIAQTLQRNGYLDAKVEPETVYDRPQRTAAITFRVDRGTAAKISAVTIEGAIAPFTEKQLAAKMRSKPGRRFGRAEAIADAARIQNVMTSADHKQADVRYVDHTYDATTHTVVLHYTVNAGPRVRIEVEGVKARTVRDALPLATNQAAGEAFDEAAEEMKHILQSNGHYEAAVTYDTVTEADGTLLTTFHAVPGPKFHLASVAIAGNREIATHALEEILVAKPKRFGRATVTPSDVERDRQVLVSYYRLSGFSEVQVEPPAVKIDAEKKTLAVRYTIVEGPQTRVASVAVTGNEEISAASLPRLKLVKGAPLNPVLLRADVVALQTFYLDRGYTQMRVTADPGISADKRSAAVRYTIAEGPKTTIGSIVVRGNTYTRTNVIVQQADLAPGRPYSSASLLEAQQKLFRLGVFQHADAGGVSAATTENRRDVVLRVDEGKVLSVSGSVGIASQSQSPTSLIGTVSISNANLFGTGRSATLTLTGSTPNKDRREAILSYREPFIGKYNLPLTFSIFSSDQFQPGAHIIKNGTSLEITKPVGAHARLLLRYEYLNSLCTDGDLCAAGNDALIPGYDKDFSDELISTITPTVYWERRDDPIDPHRGYFATASLRYAFPLFAAHAQFFREYGRFSYYVPLSARNVIAVSTAAGFIQGIGPTATDTCDATKSCVPLTERFTAGGESTHRAYPLDMLGDLCDAGAPAGCKPTLVDVDGTISPIGGLSLFVANLEYRFPIAGNVGASVFTDAGNVFAERTIDFGALRYGAGGGVRYLSPIGPLRFDIGWKIHRRSYESPYAYFLTFGYAF